jgi:hypothetical protein
MLVASDYQITPTSVSLEAHLVCLKTDSQALRMVPIALSSVVIIGDLAHEAGGEHFCVSLLRL